MCVSQVVIQTSGRLKATGRRGSVLKHLRLRGSQIVYLALYVIESVDSDSFALRVFQDGADLFES